MRLGTRERFEIGREGGDEDLVGDVCRGTDAEHRVRTRNRAIGLDVGADVDLVHSQRSGPGLGRPFDLIQNLGQSKLPTEDLYHYARSPLH